MSWVSRRQTTRVEDEAYCLLGILEVNMSMLYGEGQRAFSRLQQEVIRTHDDPSFMIWNSPSSYFEFVPAMAPDVRPFQESCDVEFRPSASRLIRPSFTYTSRGVSVTSPNLRRGVGIFVLRLDGIGIASVDATGQRVFYTVGVELLKVGPATYRRLPSLWYEDNDTFPDQGTPEHQIYILDDLPPHLDHGNPHQHDCIKFRSAAPLRILPDLCIIAKPRSAWDSADAKFFFMPSKPFGAFIKVYPSIELEPPSADYFVLAVSNLSQGAASIGDEPDQFGVYAVPCQVWELYSNIRDDVQWILAHVPYHQKSFKIHQPGRCGPFNLGSFDVYLTVETKARLRVKHTIVVEWYDRDPRSTN